MDKEPTVDTLSASLKPKSSKRTIVYLILYVCGYLLVRQINPDIGPIWASISKQQVKHLLFTALGLSVCASAIFLTKTTRLDGLVNRAEKILAPILVLVGLGYTAMNR